MVTLSLLIPTTYFGNTYSTKFKIFTQTNRYLPKKPGGNIAILLISCLHGCICNKNFKYLTTEEGLLICRMRIRLNRNCFYYFYFLF